MLCPGPQWKEEAHKRSRKVPDGRGGEVTETTTTYTYKRSWESEAVSSSAFRDGGHDKVNPSWDEAVGRAGRELGRPFTKQTWRQEQVLLAGLQARGGPCLSHHTRTWLPPPHTPASYHVHVPPPPPHPASPLPSLGTLDPRLPTK